MSYLQMHRILITHWRSPAADMYMATWIQGSHSAPDFMNTQSQSTVYILTFIPVLTYRELIDRKQGAAQAQIGQARIILVWTCMQWLTSVSITNCMTRSCIRFNKNINTSLKTAGISVFMWIPSQKWATRKLMLLNVLWDVSKFSCQTVVILCIYVFKCLPSKCIHFSLYNDKTTFYYLAYLCSFYLSCINHLFTWWLVLPSHETILKHKMQCEQQLSSEILKI